MRNVSKALASLGFFAVTLISSAHTHSHSHLRHGHDHRHDDDTRSLQDDTSTRQCGTPEPTTEQAARISRYDGVIPDHWTINVPTYFHVIKDSNDVGNSQSEVNESMEVLNNAFRFVAGQFEYQFKFHLMETTFTSDSTWFNTRNGGETLMKRALRQGECNALNIYSTSGYGYLGFAYYPDADTCSINMGRDGVVINYLTVPNNRS